MDNRPNILWFCTDQQRFDTIHALGNEYINTPCIDRFLETAVSFSHAFCQSPICTPSRASFLTGMYPSSLAVNGNGNPEFPDYLGDRLIPSQFSKAGYDCGLVGKLHLASAADGVENRVDDGYSYFQYSHSHTGPRQTGHDYADWVRAQGIDADALMSPPFSVKHYAGQADQPFSSLHVPTKISDNIPPELHQTHWCAEKSIEFISKKRDNQQPWFLSVNLFDPHTPFDPPFEYYRRYNPDGLPGAHFQASDLEFQGKLEDLGIDFQTKATDPEEIEHRKIQAAYYAMIEQLDTAFGRILEVLERKGQRENTIVIFTSDHGEMLGDHGLMHKGCRFYEGLARVPLAISYPKAFEGNRTTDGLVELLDIAPTLYELAGIETPYYVQGRSLAPLLKGKAEEHRSFVRCEFMGAIAMADQTRASMYRDNRWKLVTYHNKSCYELYDLNSDPWEHRDLSRDPEYQGVLNKLIQASFDAAINALPIGIPRARPY